MPSSQVYDMYQGPDGNIWFATDRGLARFNGYEFISYGVKEGLPDHSILQFFPQADGSVWGVTFNNQIFYLDEEFNYHEYKYTKELTKHTKSHIFSNLIYKNEELYVTFSNKAGCAWVDAEGRVSVKYVHKSYRTTGVLEIVDNQIFSYGVSQQEKEAPFFENAEVIAFNIDNRPYFLAERIGDIFMIMDWNGLYRLSDTLMIIDNSLRPIALGKLDASHFWVGYRYGGVKVFDLEGKQTEWLLKGRSVTSILVDHEGGRWISTLNSGVYYEQNQTLRIHGPESRKRHHVNNLCVDPDGNVYVAYYNGDIACLKNGKYELIYQSHIHKPGKVEYNPRNKSLYVSSDDKLMRLANGETEVLQTGYTLSFSESDGNNVYVGNYGGFYELVDTGVVRYRVEERIEDACKVDNVVFLGSRQGILEFKDGALLPQRKNPLFHYRSDDIDRGDKLVFAATLGTGLVIINGEEVRSINTKDGLYSNMVSEIHVENDSTIWVCSNQGLNLVSFNELGEPIVKGLSYEDGLISNEVTDVEIVGDIVWVATRAGLCSFNRSILEQKNSSELNYYLDIDRIFVNDKRLFGVEELQLDHDENNLVVDLRAVSYKAGDQLLYRYRLLGLEDEWTYSNNRRLQYPIIPPGNYRLEIQTKGFNSTWSQNHKTIPIYVAKPFYKTWWFYFSVIAILGSLVYLFFKVEILSYNRDITREVLRQLLKRIRREDSYVLFKEQGKEIRIDTIEIHYVKAAGNYIEICTDSQMYIVRGKISDFLSQVKDPLEFLRIHRSYIVRLDKVTKKSSKVVVVNQVEIPIGETYKDSLRKIHF